MTTLSTKQLVLIATILLAVALLSACAVGPAPTASSEAPALDNEQMLPLQESGGDAQPAESPLPTPEGEAANADVQFVRAKQGADGSWIFSVTVLHPDTGWDDYADGWDVVLPDDTVVKPDPNSPFTRLLLHPHETEQPFTRSQSGIVIPEGVEQVTVRAHELVDGWGGKTVIVVLSQSSGPDFEVVR